MADKKGAKGKPEDDLEDETSSDQESDDAAEGPVSDRTGERDDSTKGVAKALGVDDEDEDEEEAAAAKPAAPPNRAARRRDEVVKRRAARGTDDEKPVKAASEDEEDEDEDDEASEDDEKVVVAARDPLPKDKNARAKELLRRRKEAAEGKTQSIGLSAGEVVQDQLARAGGAAGRWFQRHFRKIIVGAVLGIASIVGGITYLNHRDEQAGKTSDALMKGLDAERGRVFNGDLKDPRPEAIKAADPTPVFTSFGARNEAALASYTQLAGQGTSGIAVLAKLGEAGSLLDAGQLQQAENAYADVLKSDLAKADVDVRGRATEGKGFALEGKKDFDGALAVFKELEAVDKTFEDLARYHQARMHLRKGERDQAKEILVALDKKLEIPTTDGPRQTYLRNAVGDYLRQIDPALARRPNFGGTRGAASPEAMEQVRKQMEMMKQQQGEHGDEHGDEPGGMPRPPQMPQMPIELPKVPGAEHGDDGTR